MALSALGSCASDVIAAALSLIMDPIERRDENSFPNMMLHYKQWKQVGKETENIAQRESTTINLFTSRITLLQIPNMHLPQLNPHMGVAHMNKHAD